MCLPCSRRCTSGTTSSGPWASRTSRLTTSSPSSPRCSQQPRRVLGRPPLPDCTPFYSSLGGQGAYTPKRESRHRSADRLHCNPLPLLRTRMQVVVLASLPESTRQEVFNMMDVTARAQVRHAGVCARVLWHQGRLSVVLEHASAAHSLNPNGNPGPRHARRTLAAVRGDEQGDARPDAQRHWQLRLEDNDAGGAGGPAPGRQVRPSLFFHLFFLLGERWAQPRPPRGSLGGKRRGIRQPLARAGSCVAHTEVEEVCFPPLEPKPPLTQADPRAGNVRGGARVQQLAHRPADPGQATVLLAPGCLSIPRARAVRCTPSLRSGCTALKGVESVKGGSVLCCVRAAERGPPWPPMFGCQVGVHTSQTASTTHTPALYFFLVSSFRC